MTKYRKVMVQGSVLEILLFTICINDLEKFLAGISFQLYDTVIFTKRNSSKRNRDKINEKLEALDNWWNSNKISINCKKGADHCSGKINYDDETRKES